MPDSYNEINREMNDDAMDGTHTSTMRMVVDENITGGNNDPERPVDPEKLGTGTDEIRNLSEKPQKKYRYIRAIGRGGMKMVLQVKDNDTARDVAMAVLPDATNRPQEESVRFLQEARLTASLEHPNIVPVHDIGIDSMGTPYFTMKLLRGRTLAALLEKMKDGNPEFLTEYTTTRLLRIFLKICYGVAFAHSRGVIHLDLKPENIQLGDFGEVLIIDWGLAKVIDKAEPEDGKSENDAETHPDRTVDGIMKGTPGYMAPEQAAGKNRMKDQRTDIYALGAILYAMMTLQEPLTAKGVQERVAATLAGDIIPPRIRAPERDIPAAVEAVIMKAMSLDPADRYQSVKELRNEVNAYINGYATAAEKASLLKRSMLFFKRHRIFASAVTVFLICLLAVAGYLIHLRARNLMDWKHLTDIPFDQDAGKGYCITTDADGTPRKTRLSPRKNVELADGEWLWLNHEVAENILLELAVKDNSAAVAFDVVFAAADAKPAPHTMPHGYTIRINDLGRDWCFRTDANGKSTPVYSGHTFVHKADDLKFQLLYQDGSFLVRNKSGESTYIRVSDPLPEHAGPYRIGIRPVSGSMEIAAVALSLQLMPTVPAPFVKGMILAEAGEYGRAYLHYMNFEHLYPDAPEANEALVRAFRLAAIQLNDPQKMELTRNIADTHPDFSFQKDLRRAEIIHHWRNRRYKDAMDGMEVLTGERRDDPIVREVLALPHEPLLPDDADRFLRIIAGMNDMEWLDLSGYGLKSLDPIRELPLVWLNCSGNQLQDLSVLDGLSLDYLDCRNNPGLRIRPDVKPSYLLYDGENDEKMTKK